MKIGIIAFFLLSSSMAYATPEIAVVRVPGDGIQPVAETDQKGNIHLVYFKGDPSHGNLYHSVRLVGSTNFEKPVQINSVEGSGIAIGTIRGAQMAIGREGHIHIAWMGSSKTRSDEEDHHATPMLYARSTNGGRAFEKERNLITKAYGLDGGGAIAADSKGRVEVFWHSGQKGGLEGGRRIWMTRSSDDGKTFTPEIAAWDKATGVCGCCGMTARSVSGNSLVLYRSATDGVHRDIYLLQTGPERSTFQGKRLDRWKTEICPMSAMSLSSEGEKTVAAWETSSGGIEFALLGTDIKGRVPHGKEKRKFPDLAVSPDGHVLLAWVDGGGWNKKGKLTWQLFDPKGKSLGAPKSVATTAIWTKPAVVFAEGSFLVVH